MSNECCVLFMENKFANIYGWVKTRKARKEYTCIECKEKIEKGDTYQYVRGKWSVSKFSVEKDNWVPIKKWITIRTCAPCAAIRDHYSCAKHGCTLGSMWQQIKTFFVYKGVSIAEINAMIPDGFQIKE